MSTRAFLLCGDERAVNVITRTCGELEVSFELIPEPSFAVKRLGSEHFDLVIADCDNEQAAADAFAAAKKSGVNQSAIAIAIVDGKKGVGNAFRLGASLVLAKPVSLEQARGTLRNAVAMVKKSPPEAKPMAAVSNIPASAAPAKTETQGIAAPTSVLIAPKSASANPLKTPAVAPPPIFSKPSEAALKPITGMGVNVTLPLAKEASLGGKPSKTLSLLGDEPVGSSRHPTPMFGMTDKESAGRQTSPFVMAAVVMIMITAGIYGFSVINPSFHSLVSAQFHNLGVMTGLARKQPAMTVLAKPVSPTPAPVAEPVAPPAPASSGGEATPSSTADGFAAASPAPAEGFDSGASATSTTPLILNTATTAPTAAADNEPIVVPEEVAASHITYQVQPAYPEAARKKGVKGSVVLNAAVDKDGNVSSLEVASGNEQLAPAATAAVKQWRFQSYYRDGQPTAFQTQVTVQFPQPAER